MRKVIITCAVTGAIHTPSMSPYFPVTPDDIVVKLNIEIVKIVRSRLAQRSLGLTPTGTPEATLASAVSADYAYSGQLVRELGIKAE